MWSLDFTAQVVRFACVVIISIIIGVIVSTLLAALAWRSGYNADLVFNISGTLSTLMAFVSLWYGSSTT